MFHCGIDKYSTEQSATDLEYSLRPRRHDHTLIVKSDARNFAIRLTLY